MDARDTQVRALQVDLARLLDVPALQSGVLAVSVRSLSRADVLFRYHAGTHVVPASTMKLVTLAVAAERLGWDYRFETSVHSTAPIEADGTLAGDLVVVGSGDPSISGPDDAASRILDGWADALWQRGLRRVQGRIVGDDRAFTAAGLGSGWAWDDLAFGYAAPVGALQINESSAELTITPAAVPGQAAAIAVAPAESGVLAVGAIVTGASDTVARVQLTRAAGSPVVGLSGEVPAGGTVLTRTVAVANPTLYFARMMASALRRRGIEVQGGVVDLDDLATPLPVPAGTPLFVRASPPLRDLAQPMMKESLNLDAETLLRAVGRQSGGAGSMEDGRTAASETLASWNVASGAIVQADGSGLSRYNLVTADALVEILRRMYEDPRHRDSWMAALPVGGQDGTLQRRFKGTRAEGLVRAKTGTLFNVRALAGYVPAAGGELLAFAIVVNNTTSPGKDVMAPVDAAVSRLAAFSR